MAISANCPKCQKIIKKKAKRCHHCGKKVKPKKAKRKRSAVIPHQDHEEPQEFVIEGSSPSPKPPERQTEATSFLYIFIELINRVIPLESNFLNRLKYLLFTPGYALRKNSQESSKYRNSISYFLFFLGVYMLLNHFIFSRFDFKFQLCSQFDDYFAPIILVILLSILATIGYFTLGKRYGKGINEKDFYDFKTVFVICLYIYGTNYFLAPLIIIISPYFEPLLKILPGKSNEALLGKLTDIPLALFMIYMLFDLMRRTPGFKYLPWRFAAFLILGYAYYYFMYDYVFKFKDFLHSWIS